MQKQVGVYEFLEINQEMWWIARFESATLGLLTDAHTFVLIEVLTAVQQSLRFMGNFWKTNKTQPIELKNFVWKNNFDGK